MGDGGILDKPLALLSDLDLDITVLHPSELRMEMESAIEDAVETAEDILVRMQMLEPERMMEQYCQSINETATESAKTVRNGVLNIFSKILTNVSGATEDSELPTSYLGQNPLMIDLVLRNIFQYLSIADLCSCRLVCKLWNTEAGAYVRRKQRIVFSPNCVEKMANFTAFMKAQILENLGGNYGEVVSTTGAGREVEASSSKSGNNDGDYNDNFDKSHHQNYQEKHKDGDRNTSRITTLDNNRTRSNENDLPAYTDFSFTAQFPRINFSRPIVREFSHIYGQYVKKLEIFFPNDSSLTAKDFRNFFLCGMPNVQYIHFVNLPTKLTQSSFLRRGGGMLQNCNSGHTVRRSNLRKNNGNGNITSSSIGSSDNDRCSNGTSTNSRNNMTMMISNNNNQKDNNPNSIGSGSVYNHSEAHMAMVNGEYLLAEEDEVPTCQPELHFQLQPHQDCFLKWNSLTHLKIDRTLLIEVAWSEPFLDDLFSTMPNLKHYELWTWNSTGGDGHSNPYFTCLTQSQRENLVSLYPGSVGENLLKSLADYGLSSLRKLHLPVMSGEVSAQSVELLLMNLKGTLEELQVNCSSMKDNARMIHFPRMEKLVSLHMIISVPWKNVYTLFTPSIEYQSQFPLLETLKLELAVYHDFGFIHYFFPCSGSICRTLKELDISFSGYRDEKFIGIVAKIFPNLAKLRLDGYGNRILASICLYLQNLEYFEMYLIYGFNVDDQLTGIDRKVCYEIRKCERLMDFKMDEVQVLPSLANLSKLKTLKIKQKDYQAKFWPQAQCITDITGYFALAKIKTLRHLHIESVKFSPECRQYLASALEDCWLDFL